MPEATGTKSRKKTTTTVETNTPVAVAESATGETGTAEVKELTVDTGDTATAASASETVAVEGAPAEAGKTKKAAKPAKPAIPEDQKKGNRVCAACKTPEATFLAKNARYSLCQGVDVYCYRKGHRVVYGQTLEQVQAANADKVGKTDKDGNALIEAVSGTGIKPGILVRGVPKERAKKADKPTETTATTATATDATASTTAAPVNSEAPIPVESQATQETSGATTSEG